MMIAIFIVIFVSGMTYETKQAKELEDNEYSHIQEEVADEIEQYNEQQSIVVEDTFLTKLASILEKIFKTIHHWLLTIIYSFVDKLV